jgi:ankyrin repeat protein
MEGPEFLKAIASGNGAAVREALREDSNLAKARTAEGATALQWAVYTGNADLTVPLLEAGAPVDLATVCTIGKMDAISPDADVKELSPDGFVLLGLAVAFGHNDIARLLLQQGADPNQRGTALGGVSPVHAAVFGRNLEGLKIVVDAGGDVNAKQAGGFTPLMGAAQNGDLDMVKYLLDQGADASAETDEGQTAASLASTDEIRIGLINGF